MPTTELDDLVEIATKLKKLKECKTSFSSFVKYLDYGWEFSAHHYLIMEKLQMVSEGKIKNLAIFTPPGASKSSYCSLLFPAWYMGNHPNSRVLACTHTDEFAKTWGRKVRNICLDDPFKRVFEVTIAKDCQAADRWSIEPNTGERGEYNCAGVSGAIAGVRADCLTGNVAINTKKGIIPISEIKINDEVLSYDEKNNRPCYKRVVAVCKRTSDKFLRIHTSNGNMVEATGNHKFYNGKNWVKASSLCKGDFLLCSVQERSDKATCGNREAVQKVQGLFSLLWKAMQHKTKQPQKRYDLTPNLQLVRGINRREQKGCESLFKRMSSIVATSWYNQLKRCSSQALRYMQDKLQASKQYLPIPILFNGVQESCSVFSNARGIELQLERRASPQQVSTWGRPEVQRNEKNDKHIRWASMYNLFCPRETIQPSCRPGQKQQHSAKLSNIMCQMPQENSCGYQAREDSVSMVEEICERSDVFDIQIEDTSCFFAGNTLVHNCLIIDDYIRSREDADSKTIRDKQWDWYKHDVLTRLKPNASQILLCTRWHPDDLASRILDQYGDDWTVFKLKMEIETEEDAENDPLHRKVGDILWPEWYTQEMVQRAKSDERGWRSLYQQEPIMLGGGEFKRDWLQSYSTLPSYQSMGKVMLVDPAGEKKKTSDYTSIWVIGLGTDDNYYILDMVRDRLNLTERTNMVFRLHRKWKPSVVRYEKYGLQSDIEHIKSEMARIPYSFAIQEVGGKTKKEDRIRQLIPLFQKGRVWFPSEFHYTDSSGITEDLVKVFTEQEYLAFPVSKHDDMIDALARICDNGAELPWPNNEFAAWGGVGEEVRRVQERFVPTVSSMGF